MKSSVLLLLCIVFVASVKCQEYEKFECISGQSYLGNHCSICGCEPDTGLYCTKNICPNRYISRYKECIVGTSWTVDCNKCWCIEDFGTVCTRKDCYF